MGVQTNAAGGRWTDGLRQDPRDPSVWRNPDGSIGYLGAPSGERRTGPLEIDVNGSSNPDAIADYLTRRPDMATPPPAPLDRAELARGLDTLRLSVGGAAPAGRLTVGSAMGILSEPDPVVAKGSISPGSRGAGGAPAADGRSLAPPDAGSGTYPQAPRGRASFALRPLSAMPLPAQTATQPVRRVPRLRLAPQLQMPPTLHRRTGGSPAPALPPIDPPAGLLGALPKPGRSSLLDTAPVKAGAYLEPPPFRPGVHQWGKGGQGAGLAGKPPLLNAPSIGGAMVRNLRLLRGPIPSPNPLNVRIDGRRISAPLLQRYGSGSVQGPQVAARLLARPSTSIMTTVGIRSVGYRGLHAPTPSSRFADFGSSIDQARRGGVEPSRESTLRLKNAAYQPGIDDPGFIQTAGPDRYGPRGNRPPPEVDSLRQVFPFLPSSPAGALLAPIDGLLGITEPGDAANEAVTLGMAKHLIAQIREIDPSYRFDVSDPGSMPSTWEGRANLVNRLRADKAAALYIIRGEAGALQEETLRFLQRRVDAAYAEGVRMFEAGDLTVRLSRNEAIGNFVDGQVRQQLREFYNALGISWVPGRRVRVNGREYETSGTDRTFRVPDARVGDIAFDWTLTRKTLATPQVRGFFNSDFKPAVVVIVRPSQLGQNGTYLIMRPAGFSLGN